MYTRLPLPCSRGAAHQHDLVDLGFLDELKSATEEIRVGTLEAHTSERGVEVDTINELVNFDAGLYRGWGGAHGTLAHATKTTERTVTAALPNHSCDAGA